MRILIVAGDSDLRHLLAVTLGKAGYQVLGAASAAEGLRRMAEATPDLVLLDEILPDAFNQAIAAELLRRVGQRVLLLSTQETLHSSWAAPLRAQHWVFKPFSRVTLLNTVDRVLSGLEDR